VAPLVVDDGATMSGRGRPRTAGAIKIRRSAAVSAVGSADADRVVRMSQQVGRRASVGAASDDQHVVPLRQKIDPHREIHRGVVVRVVRYPTMVLDFVGVGRRNRRRHGTQFDRQPAVRIEPRDLGHAGSHALRVSEEQIGNAVGVRIDADVHAGAVENRLPGKLTAGQVGQVTDRRVRIGHASLGHRNRHARTGRHGRTEFRLQFGKTHGVLPLGVNRRRVGPITNSRDQNREGPSEPINYHEKSSESKKRRTSRHRVAAGPIFLAASQADNGNQRSPGEWGQKNSDFCTHTRLRAMTMTMCRVWALARAVLLGEGKINDHTGALREITRGRRIHHSPNPFGSNVTFRLP